MKKRSTAIIVLSIFGSIPSAFAATNTADLDVIASVSANCIISTTPVAFGAYDPVLANLSTDLDAAGSVTVACTRAAGGLRIDLDNGSNFSGGSRRLAGGGDFLSYGLFNDPGRGSSWGSGLGANGGRTIGNSTSRTARTFDVYGRVPSAQDVGVGTYADTVLATINY